MVGLTQFFLWIVLTFGIIAVAGTALSAKITEGAMAAQTMSMDMMGPEVAEHMPSIDIASQFLSGIGNINFTLIIAMFLIYFICGYLLYASLFAAVGSAVDNEADTQQFMLPLTVPLILAIVAIPMVMQNPNGSVAVWLSMIPFTSPVLMMMRVPFGVPAWELALSIGLLVAGFILTTWLAAKIYRVGILMYGKKVSYKELWKWIRYKA
jgi:ABC-2 type transport system permease protein